MAITNNGGSMLKKPSDVICDYHKAAKDKREAASSRSKAAKTKIEHRNIVRGYKLCCLRQAEATFEFYRDIDNYELHDMMKSAEIIQKNVDAHIKKNDELEKLIKDASKMLNEVKNKLHDAHNAACAMENSIMRLVDFPENGTPGQSGTGKPGNGPKNEAPDLKQSLTKVTDQAKKLDDQSQELADAMAHTAGIQTFSNIDGLKDFGKSLVDNFKKLKTMVDERVKKSAEEVKTAQTDLTKVVEELNTYEFEYFSENSASRGYGMTTDFICNGEYRSIDQVDRICKAMGEPPENGQKEPAKGGEYSKNDQA